MPKRHKLRRGARGEEMIGALFGFLFGYMAAEGFLARSIHPLHWLAALIVGAGAYFGTLLWYRWRYPKRQIGTPVGQRQAARPFWHRWRRPGRHD